MLRVSGLEVAYGKRVVLKGIDLEVGNGELVGLVGPNGCGKTTLLRAITRVVPWQAGEVSLDDEALSGLSARELARRIAIVPQSPALPLGYTGAEVALMGRTPHLGFLEQEGPEDYRCVREALAKVGAEGTADRPVEELSAGERQNVVLARALAQAPRLLLLDEPTANLDLGHQIATSRLIRSLAHEAGLAVLAAVHDLTLASLYCDRLVLLRDGVVQASGLPAEVLTDENLKRAYGVSALRLCPEPLPAPVVVPIEAGE